MPREIVGRRAATISGRFLHTRSVGETFPISLQANQADW